MDPFDLTLRDLMAALRTGDLSVEALWQVAGERHARHGEALRPYRFRDPEAARRQARAADAAFGAGADCGPLQGLPVSVKDLFAVTGLPCAAGSARPLPAPWHHDGTLVAALRRGLAVFTGKTHTVEFAFGGLGTNPHVAMPVNPWDAALERVCGGSSAGAGVSLHVDALLALGTDTAGSVRIPAAMTGVAGLKTTVGRWPTDGVVPLSTSFDTVGLLARSVDDLWLGFCAVEQALGRAGAMPAGTAPASLAGTTLGVCATPFFEGCSPGIGEAVRAALGELEQAGARLVECTLPEFDELWSIFLAGHLAAPELAEFLASRLPDREADIDPAVRARLGSAGAITAVEYLRRRRRLAALAATAQRRWRQVDAVVTPTVAVTPPAFAELAEPARYRDANLLALRNTCPVNLLGGCAVSVPCGLDAAAMPVGLQLIAPGGDDARLLALARAAERVLGDPRARLGVPPRLAD